MFILPYKVGFFNPLNLEFLDFVLDSTLKMVTMTEAKVNTILVAGARSFLAKISFAIRPVASSIGTLVSTFPGVELAPPLHYRRFEHKYSHLGQS